MDDAQETPLIEHLRNTPEDLRAEWPIQWSEYGHETGHAMAPVGRYMHEAADRIADLEVQLAAEKAAREEAERRADELAAYCERLRDAITATDVSGGGVCAAYRAVEETPRTSWSHIKAQVMREFVAELDRLPLTDGLSEYQKGYAHANNDMLDDLKAKADELEAQAKENSDGAE